MKIYDKEIYNREQTIKSVVLVIVVFLVGFFTGFLAGGPGRASQENNTVKQQNVIVNEMQK